MVGSVAFRPNFLTRLGAAIDAFKGVPTPAQLFPPNPGIQTGYLTFPGWAALDARAGVQDEARVRTSVRSTSVFANMQAIAHEFASSELIVKERSGDGLEDVDNHDLERLWEGPNDYMGRSFLMGYWSQSYTLSGRAYLYWVPAGGQLREVWPIPPFAIKPIPASKDFIGGYLYKLKEGTEPIFIPAENITYSHSVNLFDIRDGLSFLVAAMTPIESEIAMGDWNRNFFSDSNGIPDGLIALGKDTLPVDAERVRQELRDFFGGTKRGVGVARETDMKYIPWGRSQKDAEFIQGIQLASTQIGRAMGFPDGYWSESANRANAEQARATMIAGAVWPLLVHLAEDMNAGIVKRWYGENFRVEFKDIRPEDRQLKLAEMQFYSQIETVNELRKRIGDDELDDPRGEMFLAEITKGTPLPATPAQEETDDYLAEQEAQNPAPAPEDTGALPEDTGAPAVPPEEEAAAMPTKAEDLRRWEAKALKSLKRLHRADVRFETTTIGEAEQLDIHRALDAARTSEDVRAAFKAAPRRVTVDALAGDEAVLERARKLREEAKKGA